MNKYLPLLLIVFLLMAGGIYVMNKKIDFMDEVEATYLEKTKGIVLFKDGERGTFTYPVYEVKFIDKFSRKEYIIHTEEKSPTSYQVGDSVEVLYTKEDPSSKSFVILHENYFVNHYKGTLHLIILFGIIFIFLFILYLTETKK